jgi:hypothetical protein
VRGKLDENLMEASGEFCGKLVENSVEVSA